ncbi:PREDICTED: receptor expression-enhancing protein 1 isoform X4 [Aptenodytes forsteri]|uniref:receptor expression-enhancing protein 1 isoform X4 n=1 Tax=Aptenodytes forsteri TaxID=9233 RepID=UPI0004F45444|nr:PREDICTED: receptor expression-enhancing protein 1 isoform X4 [Aptenodytes forsteri]
MVSWIISRLVVLIFGTLYPAYYSYKAVKSKDIKEYVKWMMYWIIFALFTTAETFTDIFLCWFPFYYELKIAFVAWLLSPYTKGSSLLYRKFVHPTLSSKEKEIDDCLVQAKDRSYDALVHFGKRGLNVAATAAVMAASKGQGALSERLRSFSMQDLSTIRGDSSSTVPPSVTVRTSSKQSQPKTSRSASEGTGSSVCTCCSVCRLLRGVDNKYEKPPEANCEIKGSMFSDDEENYSLDCASMNKRPKKKDQPLEAPPRTLRPRFRKKSTSSSATETMLFTGVAPSLSFHSLATCIHSEQTPDMKSFVAVFLLSPCQGTSPIQRVASLR